jgi:hypothetical protein
MKPLHKRPLDLVLWVFYLVNLLVVVYMIDLEQLTVRQPGVSEYPFWPPPFMVDLIHWYGFNFDPLLIARPPWWQATIWIDVLFFGPFYAFALYAFWKGKNWIRFGAIVWASMLITNVSIILFEEVTGPNASPELPRVFLANAAWFIFPVLTLYRAWRAPVMFKDN